MSAFPLRNLRGLTQPYILGNLLLRKTFSLPQTLQINAELTGHGLTPYRQAQPHTTITEKFPLHSGIQRCIVRHMENRLKVRRAERNVTQLTLAQLVGVSDTQISLVERGLIDPSRELIDAIAKALDAQPHELFPSLAEQQAEVR